jgi:hypothetical protein
MYQYLVLIVLIAQWLLYLNWNHVIKRRKHKEFYGRNKSYIIGFFLFFGICYCFLIVSQHIPSSSNEILKIIAGLIIKLCFLISLATLFAHLFLVGNFRKLKFAKQDLLIDSSSIFMLFSLVLY